MNPESASPESPISFETDDRHIHQALGMILLLGIGISGAVFVTSPWTDALLIFGFFALLTGGCYIYVRRRVLGHRYVITSDGISSFRGGHPGQVIHWRDIAQIERLDITVLTHDRRRISFTVPRTRK